MSDAPEMPANIARLDRTGRGLPIPWFVERPTSGKIDFRVMNPRNYLLAVKNRLCWICGRPLGRYVAFVGGPLSVAQRLFGDPPSHRDCTEYALKVCPFMATGIQRREENKPAHVDMPGEHVAENPEVFGMLIVVRYTFVGGMFRTGDPRELRWYHQGRPATSDEISAAIETARHRPEVARHPSRDAILRMLNALPLDGRAFL